MTGSFGIGPEPSAPSSEASGAAGVRGPANLIEHPTVEVNGARLHVARAGRGRPLLLLHGWPECWLTWEPVMKRLADRYQLIAPDLRGFGSSDKPAGPFGPEDQAADLAALIGVLDIAPVGVVSHDIGATIAQTLARRSPDLIVVNRNHRRLGSQSSAVRAHAHCTGAERPNPQSLHVGA